MSLLQEISTEELKSALLHDFHRKILIYKMTDNQLKKKYGMEYSEFESRGVVAQKNHSWESESDAMEWEHALAGLEDLNAKLRRLESDGN